MNRVVVAGVALLLALCASPLFSLTSTNGNAPDLCAITPTGPLKITQWFLGATTPGTGTVHPGDKRHACVQVRVFRDKKAGTPTQVTLIGAVQVGTLHPSYIDAAELWHDKNVNGVLDGPDVLLAQASQPVFTNLTTPLIAPDSGMRFLITVDVSVHAPSGQTIQLHVPDGSYIDVTDTAVFISPTTGALGTEQTLVPVPVPQIEVSDSVGVFVTGAAAADGRDFGTVDVAAMPTAQSTITISNTGTGDLTLGTPALAGSDFALDISLFSNVVAAGGSTSFGVVFDAATLGAKSGSVSFAHNAGSPGVFSFDVAGIAASGNQPVIMTQSLPAAPMQSPYGPFQIAVTGGHLSLEFTVASGAVPPGLQLATDGQIVGVPTAAGMWGFTVRVTDSVGATHDQALAIDVYETVSPERSDQGSGGCAVGGGALLPLLLPTLLLCRRRRRTNR